MNIHPRLYDLTITVSGLRSSLVVEKLEVTVTVLEIGSGVEVEIKRD